MSKSILGVPVVLLFFVIVLLAPLLIGEYIIFKEIKASKDVVFEPVVAAPTATATPSATTTPTTARRSITATPTK